MPFAIIEAFLLTSALSMDALAAGFAYGGNGIKISFWKAMLINIICSVFLGLSLILGAAVRDFVPQGLAEGISFGILFIIGMSKLLDSFTKSLIRKYNGLKKEIRFSFFNFGFILNVYANPEQADADASKALSAAEAAVLAAALSLDGLAVGFGAAMGSLNVAIVFAMSLVTDLPAILLGSRLGNKLARKRLNLNWIGGVVLIALAFTRL